MHSEKMESEYTIPQSIRSEARTLLSVFKNAVSFTLAITTLTEISKDSPDYLYLIMSTISGIVFLSLIQYEMKTAKQASSNALNSPNGTQWMSAIHGPIKCISFLVSITLNILTQFLSTLIARYIITFVPDTTNIYQVGYILILVLCLFWCGTYSIGIDLETI